MARPVRSTSPAADEIQVRLLRNAGTAGRVARARSLSQSVIGLSRRAIQRRHPEWSEREVLLEFVAVHYGRELADRVRHHLERRGR
jgi:hypothetical protein